MPEADEPESRPEDEAGVAALPVHPRARGTTTRHMGGLVVVLAAASVWIGWAFFGTILFASWFVIVFWPWREKLARKFARPWLASLILTTGIIVTLVGPIIVGGILLGFMLADFAQQAIEAFRTGNLDKALSSVLGSSAPTTPQPEDLRSTLGTIFRSLPTVVGGIGTAFGVVADTIVRIFLFIVALYYLFVGGKPLRGWIAHSSPLQPYQTRRLMQAYSDIGRGMLVGVLLVVVIHGAIAMLGYVIVGVPRAIELGFLTALAGFVPAIGTALVWVPLAVVLAVTGHLGKGIGVVVVGLIVGVADNIARPWLAKLGQVPMPTLSLFWAIFAGIATIGPVGLLIGPVIFGMTQAALELYIENKEWRARRAERETEER